jgi:adenylate cyclase
VVKTIGDEVMFVAGDAASAARIALRLTERSAVDELLPEARAGLAGGTVLAQEGDYYGPVVNLASRLVELARPGSVLVSTDLHAGLADHPALVWQRLRSRRIRDIGRVEVWALERAEQHVPEPES